MNTPKAALILARRHVSLAKAHAVLTRLLRDGSATVEVPSVEDLTSLQDELEATGIRARRSYPLPVPDVRAIRHRLKLSQEDFALEYGLEVGSVRNWEQGRADPDAATRTVLWTIAVRPEAVREAVGRDTSTDDESRPSP